MDDFENLVFDTPARVHRSRQAKQIFVSPKYLNESDFHWGLRGGIDWPNFDDLTIRVAPHAFTGDEVWDARAQKNLDLYIHDYPRSLLSLAGRELISQSQQTTLKAWFNKTAGQREPIVVDSVGIVPSRIRTLVPNALEMQVISLCLYFCTNGLKLVPTVAAGASYVEEYWTPTFTATMLAQVATVCTCPAGKTVGVNLPLWASLMVARVAATPQWGNMVVTQAQYGAYKIKQINQDDHHNHELPLCLPDEFKTGETENISRTLLSQWISWQITKQPFPAELAQFEADLTLFMNPVRRRRLAQIEFDRQRFVQKEYRDLLTVYNRDTAYRFLELALCQTVRCLSCLMIDAIPLKEAMDRIGAYIPWATDAALKKRRLEAADPAILSHRSVAPNEYPTAEQFAKRYPGIDPNKHKNVLERATLHVAETRRIAKLRTANDNDEVPDDSDVTGFMDERTVMPWEADEMERHTRLMNHPNKRNAIETYQKWFEAVWRRSEVRNPATWEVPKRNEVMDFLCGQKNFPVFLFKYTEFTDERYTIECRRYWNYIYALGFGNSMHIGYLDDGVLLSHRWSSMLFSIWPRTIVSGPLGENWLIDTRLKFRTIRTHALGHILMPIDDILLCSAMDQVVNLLRTNKSYSEWSTTLPQRLSSIYSIPSK
jgi:hypothetical protein